MASSAARGKLAEGQEYVRQAEKCMKTSLFKWKPDYDGAAMDYGQAATCFKNAKAPAQCKDCHIKAADCHVQNQALFSAAKSLEQAAIVSKEMGDLDETIRLIDRACKLFQEHGSPDTAALTLEKGAKMVEAKYPEKSASLYLRAADVVMVEDRPRQAAEYLGKAARLQLKLQMLDDASATVEREIEMNVEGGNPPAAGRLTIGIILIHLSRGDVVAAQKAFQSGRNLICEEEVDMVDMLIEAFDQEDGEAAARALNNPFIKHLDVEYAKLARRLVKIDSEGRQNSITSSDSSSSLSTKLPVKREQEEVTERLGNVNMGDKNSSKVEEEEDDDEGLL
ncbi:hypothetical protein CHUAL_011558 [Chamberlinius hualienensis]